MRNVRKEERDMAKKGKAAKPGVKKAAKRARVKDLPAKAAKDVKGGVRLRTKAY